MTITPAITMYLEVLSNEGKKFPTNFFLTADKKFDTNKAYEIIRYLIEDILKWDDEQLKNNFSYKILQKYRLSKILKYAPYFQVFSLINLVYPNKFHEWEFKKVPNKFWTEETTKQATIWLINEKLHWTDDDIREKLNAKVFTNNNLSSVLNFFDNSPIKAIQNAYPNKFKEWEFSSVPNKFWTEETAKQAIIWLIEEKLKLNDDELKEKLCSKMFIDNGIGSALAIFNNSPIQAIQSTYPGKFYDWEFKIVPHNFWNLEKAREATIWLIEEKLKWDDNQIKQNLHFKTFRENNLCGMLQIIFSNSPFKAIDCAYPGRFHEWELSSTPKGYWNLDTAKVATIWLVEEKLNKKQLKNISRNDFVRYGLNAMLNKVFNGNVTKALKYAYNSN